MDCDLVEAAVDHIEAAVDHVEAIVDCVEAAVDRVEARLIEDEINTALELHVGYILNTSGTIHLLGDEQVSENRVTLVVQGKSIPADRWSLSLVSKFFKALFSHQFEDSNKPVVTLDISGEMGLTVTAIKVLTNFAQTRKLEICCENAIQIFIAADALDVESVRRKSESYLGAFLLNKDNFPNFWKMSRFFHMKILETFLDGLVVENFGWFSSCMPMTSYLSQWELQKLRTALLHQKFRNCSEEQIFQAVVAYCRIKGSEPQSFESLIPGLYRSCSAYLRYIQSVPRTITYKS